MTVANQTNRIAAVGNAAIGQEVPFSFPYAATSDITVYSRVTATGVETLLAETTNYTLTAASDTGGTLTTVTAVAATSEIHIIRKTPKTQALDLEAGGSFSAEDVEDALDKNTRLIIENKDNLERTLVFPNTDPSSSFADMPNSIDRASKNLTFDSDGKPIASVSVEEGSVTFTDFGTSIAEAADADTARGLLEMDTDDDVEFAEVTATDIITKSPWIDVRAYGTYTTDIGNSINLALAALPATGGRINLPASATAFPQTTAISITKPCEIVGMGRGASIIEKTANIVGITINTATGRILLEDFTFDSDGSDAGKNGITITRFQRGVVSRVEVKNQSNHGIEFLKGNLSSFRDIQCSSNGGDGFKVNASDNNCNACVFSNIDCSSNTGWGFNLNSGDDNWLFGIIAQSNGNGIRINDYGNVVYAYAEANAGEDVELTAAAKANIVHSILPNEITVDSYSFNTIYDRIGGEDFVAVRGWRNGGVPLSTLANEATPTVVGRNLFKTGGTTTITDFDNGQAGQVITVLCKHSLTFDFTTAQDADHNLDGSSADITADTGDVLKFLCEDGTTWYLISSLDASADNN